MTERWRERLGTLDTIEPSGDLWQRATTRSTDTFSELPPGPSHRVVAVVVAVALAATGLAGVAIAFGRGPHIQSVGPTPKPATGLITYRDPTGTWEIQFPRTFHAGTRVSPDGLTGTGIWIANVPTTTEGPSSSSLPRDAVVIGISPGLPGGAKFRLPVDPRDSRFPIRLNRMKVAPGPGDVLAKTIVANGNRFFLYVRVGPERGSQNMETAQSIIASLRYLPLETGGLTGTFPVFQVLGSANQYPQGSVTRFDLVQKGALGRVTSFYLVHSRRGYFALASSSDRSCAITFDARYREFTCGSLAEGPAWALDGTPLPNFFLSNAGHAPTLPLRVLLTRISLDGHVLVAPLEVPLTDDLRLTRGA